MAVANNTQILQTAVDRYALDHDGKYPIKNGITINLQNPQLIDVELLRKEGYIKKELDISKVKNQYYWLDVFSVAWGSTEKTIDNISLVSGKENRLEFITPEGSIAYRVYEVTGYSKTGDIVNKKDRHYKLVSEVKLNKKIEKVSFIVPDPNKSYLISAVDKYEQETAPVGPFYRGASAFKPILQGDGKYEFEIESLNEMIWVDFLTLESKPGNSTIEYRFKVKDSNGVYGAWTDDYFSLPNSTGIIVEVEMKSDADGNRPSLYDINVVYRYPHEDFMGVKPVLVGIPEESNPELVCKRGREYTTLVDGKWLQGQPKIAVYSLKAPDSKSINKIRSPFLHEYNILNVKYEYLNVDGIYVPVSGTFEIPSGSCINIIYELETIAQTNDQTNSDYAGGGGSLSGPKPAVPDVVLCEKNCAPICEDCIPKCLVDCRAEADEQVTEDWCDNNECITPSKCEPTDTDCVPPVCMDNCSEGPPGTNPKDAELNDPEWVTVNELRFYAHGPQGQKTLWTGMIPNEEVEAGKTRIVYRFAKSNGLLFSKEIDDIAKVGQSKSLMVVAYLQVHKDLVSDPNQKPPVLNGIKILHEQGEINLDRYKPTMVILPYKDNNKGRDVFTDASRFDWKYQASDPRWLKITEVEWGGDKREQYPVGTYTIKARVKNEASIWSDWAEFTFDVVSDKPIARITKNLDFIPLNKNIIWSASQSFDPDGDNIVKFEWRGDKQNVYTKEGVYTIGLRVQDEEGHWSEWVEETFNVINEGLNIYRLEAEETDTSKVKITQTYYGGVMSVVKNDSFSEGKYVLARAIGGDIEFKFTGSGFDLKQFNPTNALIVVDGKEITNITVNGDNLYVFRGLEDKEHSLIVRISTSAKTSIDYIDVYSEKVTPDILDIHTTSLDKNNTESIYNVDKVVPSLGQKSKTYYTLYKNAYTTVGVYDLLGKEVRSLQSNVLLKGGTIRTHGVVWDGKDNSGNYVGTGEYTLKINAVGVDKQSKKEKTHRLYVDNEKPVYRIEAEDTDISRVKLTRKSNGILQAYTDKGSTYSGEGFVLGRGVEGTLEFKFKGTGFDLMQINPNAAEIVLDGSALLTITQEGENNYSVRNLENKQHTLVVNFSTNTKTYIDYLDVYDSDDTPSLLNIHSTSLNLNNVEQNYESNLISILFGSKIKTDYTLVKDAYVTIGVYNSIGKEIRTLQDGLYQTGGSSSSHSIVWDGKDDSGDYVSNGSYTIRIQAIGVDRKGLTENKQILLVADGNPVSRIEVEDPDISKVERTRFGSSGTFTVSNKTIYSGGKYLFMRSFTGTHYGQVEFKFTGTGFDLKQYNPTNVQIILDGKELNNLTYTGEHNYSVRDLANGQHSLILRVGSGAKGEIDYLDIYN